MRPLLTIQHPSTNGDEYHGDGDDSGYIWQDDQSPAADLSRTYSKDLPKTPVAYGHPPPEAPQSYRHASMSRATGRHDLELQTPAYVPRPEMPEQNGLSEKELARRAEQRLLPSQPDPANGCSEAGPSSQPIVPALEDASVPPSPMVAGGALDIPHNSLARSSFDMGGAHEESASAPSLAELRAALPADPVDDKQELERRRLLEEASAPPEIPEEYAASVAGPSALPPPHTGFPSAPGYAATSPSPGPSAPPAVMLTSYHSQAPMHDHDVNGGPSAPRMSPGEDDHFEARDPLHMITGSSDMMARGSEQLPRYER